MFLVRDMKGVILMKVNHFGKSCLIDHRLQDEVDVMLALNTKIDLSYFWSGDYSYFERITVYKQRKVD